VQAGLIPVERCVALLARAAEHDLVARGSFFQRDFIRKQREAGLPLHLIAHEDVLVFRTRLFPGSSDAPAERQARNVHQDLSRSNYPTNLRASWQPDRESGSGPSLGRRQAA
jgi:hypothetical protein